jgi:hypothetical protein
VVNKSLPIEKLRKHVVPFAGVAGFSKRISCKRVCLHAHDDPVPAGGRSSCARAPSAEGGRAHRTGRSRGAFDAHRLCSFRCSVPNCLSEQVIVGRQTMFTPPPTKKARQPLMSGQRDVCARAGAAPTGAAATGGVPTPLREEPWPTRPQISVHCDSPSPSPGHDRGRFAAVFGSPQASLRPWPSSMVAAVPGWVLETPPPSFAGRAPVCALSWYVGVR